MESGNEAENSQQYRDSDGGSVSGNPTGVASITVPLSSSASPSPRLNVYPGGMYNLIAEATRFSADIKRLSGELTAAKQRIAVQDKELAEAKQRIVVQDEKMAAAKHRIGVQDEELAQLQDRVHQQTFELAETKEKMTEQQNKIAELEEEKQVEGLDLDNKELRKISKAFGTKTRTDGEEKLQKMKQSMKAVMGELDEFIVELVGDVEQEDYRSANSSTATGRNWDLTPQSKLDRLSDFVEKKFDAWAASQRKLKTELTNVNAVFRKLEKVLKTKRVGMSSVPSTSSFGKRQQQQRTQVPQRSLGISPSSVPSQRTNAVKTTMSTNTRHSAVVNPLQQTPKASTSQIQIKEEFQPPPKTVPGNEFHAEDTARFNEGYFCICGMDYSSRSNLRTHVRKFTEDGKFKCQVCKQRFLHFHMLRSHLKDKHKISNNKSVGCSVCGKKFKTFTSLYAHRKSAHPKESFKKRNASSAQPANSSSWKTTQQSFYDEGDDDDIIFIGAVTAATATTATTSAQPPPPPTYSNDTDENDEEETERPINYFGKRHGFDNTKCRQEFFCICGSKFLHRRKLDIHVRRSNQQDLTGNVVNYNDDFYEVVVHDETEEVEVEEQQLFRRHDKIVRGSRKKRTPNLTTRHNGFNRRGRGRHPNAQFSRVRTTQVRRRPSTSSSTINRITVHHSAIIGQSKKGRLADPGEDDPPMPKLKKEEPRWVSTSAAATSSPQPSPQAISIDDENGAPVNDDWIRASSSSRNPSPRQQATRQQSIVQQQESAEQNMENKCMEKHDKL